MRPYADAVLEVTEELREVVTRIQGEELRMMDISNIGHFNDGSYNLLVECLGLDGDLLWEPVGNIFHDAPQVVEGKLRKGACHQPLCRTCRGVMVWRFRVVVF